MRLLSKYALMSICQKLFFEITYLVVMASNISLPIYSKAKATDR